MVFLRGLFCAESRQNPAESPETKTCVQNQRNSGKNFSFLCGETAQRAQTTPPPKIALLLSMASQDHTGSAGRPEKCLKC